MSKKQQPAKPQKVNAKPRVSKARRRQQKGMCLGDRPVLEPNAGGVDVGAREMFVAVPPGRDENPVRVFATFTEDLERLADWLVQCGVTTVAMESTGVYWIPLYDILEQRGIRPCLVNARHMKNVPGRRTDWFECQWLQFLHSVGLLAPGVSTGGGHLRCTDTAAAPQRVGASRESTCAAHAQVADTNEYSDPSRHQRYHRRHRTGHCGRNRGRPTGCSGVSPVARPPTSKPIPRRSENRWWAIGG